MDIAQLVVSAIVLLLVVVGVAVVCAVVWQLLKISRDARAQRRRARKEAELEASIRLALQAQGFGEDEVRDAIRHLRADQE